METIPLRKDYRDATVQRRIATFLDSRNFSSFNHLEVSVVNRVATIYGVVDSFYEKQVALNSCKRVAGVIDVVDDIRVENHADMAEV